MKDFINPLEIRIEKLEKRIVDRDKEFDSLITAYQIIEDRLPYKDYYTQIEAAFYLGVSEADIAEIAGKKMIQTCKPFDGRLWFLKEDMNDFLRDAKNGKSAFIASKNKTKKVKK